MNFDFVFLGGLFPKEEEETILRYSKGSIQNAANALQWNLIEGFDEVIGQPITIVNSLYIGSYPKRYKKIKIPEFIFHHVPEATDYNLSFLNLTYIKSILREKSIKCWLKKWAARNTEKEKVIVAYALTTPFVNALVYIKKINPKIHTFIIVPDLPQYMDSSKNLLYKFLKNIDVKHIKKCLSKIDGYVLLTEQMNEFIGADNYTVVEGIASDYFSNVPDVEDDGIKKIVYTGTLAQRYGICNLVDAFMRINKPDYQLIICGYGDSEQYIKEAQMKDKRIKFMGSLKREEALSIQKSATLLVNPRQGNSEFTKYSFPSKNLEYLSSGKPLLGYRLEGIPTIYDQYMYFVPDDTIESLADKMVFICEMDSEERKSFGLRARDFVIQEKNKVNQSKKILEMIKNTINTEK